MRKTKKWYYAMENKHVIDLLVKHNPSVGLGVLRKWENLVYQEITCKQLEKALEQGIALLNRFDIPYKSKYVHGMSKRQSE